MSRQAILIGLIAAFTVLSSCGEQIPTIPTSAGKAVVEGEPRSYIVWECGADEWVDADDATWTIFFHGQFRLYIEGTTVEISEYISPTTKMVYEAGEPGRPNFALYAHGSWCAATTELIGTEIPDIRIWRGDVDWLYRNDPQNSSYVLYENDLVYQIGRIEEDDAVGYIDFQSVHHRNNRPILEVGARAVWPVNVDQVKRDSIEVLGQVPADDRPYLLDVICQGAACPDFVQDIEQDTALQDQLVRNFQERQASQSPSEETVRNEVVPQEIVREVQGEEGPLPPIEDQGPTTTILYSIEDQGPTTTILYTNNVGFVSQEEPVTSEPRTSIEQQSYTTDNQQSHTAYRECMEGVTADSYTEQYMDGQSNCVRTHYADYEECMEEPRLSRFTCVHAYYDDNDRHSAPDEVKCGPMPDDVCHPNSTGVPTCIFSDGTSLGHGVWNCVVKHPCSIDREGTACEDRCNEPPSFVPWRGGGICRFDFGGESTNWTFCNEPHIRGHYRRDFQCPPCPDDPPAGSACDCDTYPTQLHCE